MGYRAQEYQAARIKITIEQDIEDSIWNLSALINIPDLEENRALREALKQEISHNYDHIFMLLELNYDPESIKLVKENIESGISDNITFALELLDTFITEDLKPKLFPLLDDIPVSEKIRKLDEFFAPESFENFEEVCRKIINRDYNRLNRYTKALALFYLSKVEGLEVHDYIVACMFSNDPLMRQTAAWVIYNVNLDEYERHTSRLRDELKKRLDRVIVPPVYLREEIYQEHLKIERVLIMKDIGIFKNLPGVVITELEDYVREVELHAGDFLVKEGESGNTPMFVLISGVLEVVKGDKVLGTIDKQDLIGESHIVRTDVNEVSFRVKEKAVILKLDKEKFYELTSKNHQMVNGLLRSLESKIK
jgi:hypothetical protein